MTPVLVGRTSESSADAEPWTDEGSGEDIAYVIYTSGSTGAPERRRRRASDVVRLFKEVEHWFDSRVTTSGRCSTP